MSSMVRLSSLFALLGLAGLSSPALAQDGSEWDHARTQTLAGQRGAMTQAIERWKLLVASNRYTFSDYAGFLLTYPGFPNEEKLRIQAEAALDREVRDSGPVIAFFQKFPPITNAARAQYALAMAAQRREGASDLGIAAWRGGAMSDASESALLYLYAPLLTRADHDARMDALLWDGATAQAERQIAYVSPEAKNESVPA